MEPVYFVHLSDTHFGPTEEYKRQGHQSLPYARHVIDMLNRLPTRPDFVVHTGDVTTHPTEAAYLLAAVESQFPSLGITLGDVVAAFAGVRPVIGSGKEDPSEESRDHVVWVENGLLTVTGGKMTTFRLIALDALKEVRHLLPDLPELADNLPVLNPVDLASPGRHGQAKSSKAPRAASTCFRPERRRRSVGEVLV